MGEGRGAGRGAEGDGLPGWAKRAWAVCRKGEEGVAGINSAITMTLQILLLIAACVGIGLSATAIFS